MKIKIHPYQRPWSAEYSRSAAPEGVLIALEELEGVVGYANLHPWPTLGDQRLDEQLQLWQRGHTTPQMQRSLEHARRDARARAHHKIGVHYFPKIESHFLFLEQTLSMESLRERLGLRALSTCPLTAKWKLSPATMKDAALLLNEAAQEFPNLRWRLDANALFTSESLRAFWNLLAPSTKGAIAFIEDPCPYEEKDWAGLAEVGMPLAIDFQIEQWQTLGARPLPQSEQQTTFVLKPALQEMPQWKEWLIKNPHPVVITSYLDHPVGLLHSLWWAEELSATLSGQLQLCGLNLPWSPQQLEELWPGLYQDPEGHNCWQGEPSPGIGFTHLLEALSWQELGKN